MKVKILTFKPNKNGEVTLYLGAGADLRELIDLIGQEVDIMPVSQQATQGVADDLDIENILNAVQRYGHRRYQEGMLNEIDYLTTEKPATATEPQTEGVDPASIPIDPLEFGGGV